VTDRFDDLADPNWLALFQEVRSSWFRLETLQAYGVAYEDEEFGSFLDTGRFDRDDDSWQKMIRGHVDAGRNLRRVHVVEEPLSDYLRYEFAAYELNQEAGEDIRLIRTDQGEWPSGLPREEDFWIFDDADAWSMEYDADGRFLAAERVTDPAKLEQYRQWRDVALATSMSLTEYTHTAA
jgi:hypothetical protein